MERIEIGKSGPTTSRIGLGTWAIGGWMWGGTDEAQSIATIRSAVERGITLIDTAPAYGFGRSEEIVGKALAEGSLRDKVQIATKVGLAWKDGKVFRDSRPARIRKEIEDSLRRLRTDVIDLYQVHWPDFEMPIAETARTLEDLRREGKILRSASAIFHQLRCVCSALASGSTQCSRLTICLSVQSRRMCCPTQWVQDLLS